MAIVAQRLPALTLAVACILGLLAVVAGAVMADEHDPEGDDGEDDHHQVHIADVARQVHRTATPSPTPSPTPTISPGQAVSTVIGTSVQGRPISATRIGGGAHVVAVIGGVHTGAEVESVEIVERLRDRFVDNPSLIPAGVSMVFVPKANPDGYAAGTRVNARGVDLNRNWLTEDWEPYAFHGPQIVNAGSGPLSEPETRALYDYLLDLEPAYAVSFHGYAGLIEGNDFDRTWDLTEAYARAANYVHLDEWTAYPITGQFIDSMEEAGLPAADVELQQHDPRSFERNLAGLLAVLALVP